MVVQRLNGSGVERQIVWPFDHAQMRRQLLHQEAIADPAARRRVKDDLLAAPAFQNSLLDHIVERRRVADMARPDFIEHAIGAFRDAEGFRLGEVEIVRALK